MVKEREKKKIFAKTYGCLMNEYDTERIFSMLKNDFSPVNKETEADVIFINTCSVRDKAEKKLYSYLGNLKKLKSFKPNLIVGVGGCVAQQEGRNLINRSKIVNFVVGTHNISFVPSLIKRIENGDSQNEVVVDYRDEWEELSGEEEIFSKNELTSSFGAFYSPIRALVSIQRGCNKKCAYCVVPYTRGEEVSRCPDEIEREIRIKISKGAKEVLLLGQTVNSYGRKRVSRVTFEDLIRRIDKIEGLERIRFTSPHPAEVRPSFIELFTDVKKLMPQIHLPLQSGSNRILKLMHRNYTVSKYMETVYALKSKIPNIAITSDIIVGFPTETEDDFKNTLEVMKEVLYSSSYSFRYSIRPNTYAFKKYKAEDEVLKEVAKNRLICLQSLQKDLSLQYNNRFIDKKVKVLVEAKDNSSVNNLRGRNKENILVNFKGRNVGIGEVVDVKITSASPHGLKGKVCS